MARRRRATDEGASLVEFALILPLFMMLILGMISGGVAYNKKISITNAVREGARYGATFEDDPAVSDDLSTAVIDHVDELAGTDLGPSDICVQLVRIGNTPPVIDSSPATCPASIGAVPDDPPHAVPGDCVVKIWSATKSKLEAMVFSYDLTLKAQTKSRYEREC
jgi:hypothetical protein